MTEMKIPEVNVGEIYKSLKDDLRLCVKYHRRNKPELVKEYFGTENREEIQKQLQVICKPFSLIQRIQIEGVIAELHNFYIQPEETCQNDSKKSSSQKGKSSNERTTLEA